MTEILGNCEKINRLNSDISKIAKLRTNLLITGQTGTGKSIIAKSVHHLSEKTGEFITISYLKNDFFESDLFGHKKGAFTGATSDRCGAIKKAKGGTLFIDEIGDLPQEIQVKLLRLLETGEYSPLGSDEVLKADARFIFATHVNLEKKVEDGEFRQDLFYRINVIDLKVPSLSERGEDVLLWINLFFSKTEEEYSTEISYELKKEFIEKFKNYSWAGNLRELKNLIQKTVLLDRTPDINTQINKNFSCKSDSVDTNKKHILTSDEEIFKLQAKIYKQFKHSFSSTIFDKISLGNTSKENAELIFMRPFILSAFSSLSSEQGSVLGMSQVNYVAWFHKLRNHGFITDSQIESYKGKSLPVGVNLLFILRKHFMPEFYHLTFETIKNQNNMSSSESPSRTIDVLKIDKKEFLAELKQHEQNLNNFIKLAIW